MSDLEAQLSLEAAVPLGYALALRAAADAGVRALAIKGPVLALQGLREHKQSVDVDVWVEPAGLPAMQAELERLGWHDAYFYDTPVIVPHHSRTHTHPLWPNEIDVHHWFPGFLADQAEVFDVLWSRRTTARVAGQELAVPDLSSHAAIEALHHLRDQTLAYRRERVEALAVRIETTWTAEQRADLSALAADTGASRTLGDFLERVGAPRVAPTRPVTIPYDDWRLMSELETSAVVPWLVGLSRTPWWRRPAFVWNAIWLGDDRFQLWEAGAEASRRDLLRARGRRLLRAVRTLPSALRDYRRTRRGIDG